MRNEQRRQYMLELGEEIQVLRNSLARSSEMVGELIRFRIDRLESEKAWQEQQLCVQLEHQSK